MQLTTIAPTPVWDAFETPANQSLNARLSFDDPAPVAVAISGGGDSLCLLLLAKAWADRRGRRLVALTVDHGLQPDSGRWALSCLDRIARLGVESRLLAWDGPKPATGLSAAARAARHRLLAESAREAGAAVILMGHTADDRAEAALMRQEGSTAPSPREWAPSPVWPEGRGLFILRPLLAYRRSDIRVFLAAAGETWIDDPANDNPASARARARGRLASVPGIATDEQAQSPGPPPALRLGPAGDLMLSLAALMDRPDAAADLGAALVSASGSQGAPRRERRERLLERLTSGRPVAATLAGARVRSDGGNALFVRDAADRRGAGGQDLTLRPGRETAWDGRFAIRANAPDIVVGLLHGRMSRLPPDLRRAVGELPPSVRPALPVLLSAGVPVAIPTVLLSPLADVKTLTAARFLAARGGIVDEAGLRSMAKTLSPS